LGRRYVRREADVSKLATIVLLAAGAAVVVTGAWAAGPASKRPVIMAGKVGAGDDFPANSRLFTIAQSGTTWFGWSPSGAGPWKIGTPGVWDFDDGGTFLPPGEYIKNGAYSQGWTSEDVLHSDGLWAAEDFTEPELACSSAPLVGDYSAWCGKIAADPPGCYHASPGYGALWNEWMMRTVTLEETAPTLSYVFSVDTETGYDYCYVIIDSQYPDSCGWAGPDADTLRCHSGSSSGTETIDLSNWASHPDACDKVPYDLDYSGDRVKICFVVVSDGNLDDEDGGYDSCDGAFIVDDILIDATPSPVVTEFESGTLAGWETCAGYSSGDYAAIRSTTSFPNNDPCGFESCGMSGAVLTFFEPAIAGHPVSPDGRLENRAWSPSVDLSTYPPRGYALSYDIYADLPQANWIFYTHAAKYVQDGDCPAGAWSPPVRDSYVYYMEPTLCLTEEWNFSSFVPADAESVKVGLSVLSGAWYWSTPPYPTGNESPIFDNVKLGVFDLSYPVAELEDIYNYCDAFPELEELYEPYSTALIDIAYNHGGGAFVRLGDTLVVSMEAPDAQVELCFRIEPGTYTDVTDQFFVVDYPDAGGWSNCELSDDYFCTRMDTVQITNSGGQVVEGRYASTIHESDPVYEGYEGVEIFPDSLFTPGTKIYYSIRTSFVGGASYGWLPPGADMDDVSTLYEVMVLPDLCKDPVACLLYVDYYNRGAQEPIETALSLLGRTWDRFDYRAETSHQANGIGNRLLGPAGAFEPRARGPIGPSLNQSAQYTVLLLNNGDLPHGSNISDGGVCVVGDLTNDILFLDSWINEGVARGLWFSGNSIASDFTATGCPKDAFLKNELGTSLAYYSYRELVSHPLLGESCRTLKTKHGLVTNNYSVRDYMRVTGSGCPQLYDFDVLDEYGLAPDLVHLALLYDRTDLTAPPGYYASVDHIYKTVSAPFDTVRTKIDGFSLHYLRDEFGSDGHCSGALSIAFWMRDVLGGNNNLGYFYDRESELQYCPPEGDEDPILDAPWRPDRTYKTALFQNYPNPFRGGRGTTIHYSVAAAGAVEIRVFDVAGRLVRSIGERAKPGDNYLVWDGKWTDGRAAASGVYFYQIVCEGFTSHRKMTLLR
jgi:hypothetical protein